MNPDAPSSLTSDTKSAPEPPAPALPPLPPAPGGKPAPAPALALAPDAKPSPRLRVPWRTVGVAAAALAAVAAVAAGGFWWSHSRSKGHAAPAPASVPGRAASPVPAAAPPPPSPSPEEAKPAPAPVPVPAPAPPPPAALAPGPLTPLTPLVPSEAESSAITPIPSEPAASPGDADRASREPAKAAPEREAAPAPSSPAVPLLPPPAAFPEVVLPPGVPPAPSRPAPTAAGELRFVPGPLQPAREGAAAAVVLPDIGPPPTPVVPVDEDGGSPESAADLKLVDFGNIPDAAVPRVPPPSLPFVLLSRVLPSPWDAGSELVFVGLQPVLPTQLGRPRANLVFLIDDSISMGDPDKLPLVRHAIDAFLDRLEPDDRVALVVYAGDSALLLPATPVQGNRDRIRAAFAPDRLMAVETDRPGASLQMAYDIARNNFVKDGFNRVIAITDGDLNLGVGEAGGLYDYVSRNAREGITLSLVGVGGEFAIGPKVRQLLRAGRGRVSSARSVGAVGLALDKEVALPSAEGVRDLRLEMPVGPDRAAAWRLVGYQNRLSPMAGGGFLAVYEVRKTAATPGPQEMSLRFRRESTAADEILARSLDSGPPRGLDPRVFRDFASVVGDVRKRVESLSEAPVVETGR